MTPPAVWHNNLRVIAVLAPLLRHTRGVVINHEPAAWLLLKNTRGQVADVDGLTRLVLELRPLKPKIRATLALVVLVPPRTAPPGRAVPRLRCERVSPIRFIGHRIRGADSGSRPASRALIRLATYVLRQQPVQDGCRGR
jgi:hypothetical protein